MTHRFLRATARAAAASLALAAFAAVAAGGAHRHGPYGDYDVIHEFDGTSATGGSLPYGALAYANDGKVYGDTYYVDDTGSPIALGGLFQLGSDRSVALVQTTGPRETAVSAAREGGLFLTYIKDAYLSDPDAWGYVVHQAGAGVRQVLHHFSQLDPAGYYPQPLLSEGADGSLYGATEYGGANGNGTIFRLAPDGSVTALAQLQPFGTEAPFGTLVGAPAADGNLYVPGWRGIYRITPAGVTTLAAMLDDAAQGNSPPGPLVSGPDGALYGTANYDGPAGGGTVFRLDISSGVVTVLHAFDGSPHGPHGPNAALALGADGYFYGTLESGGPGHEGGIFRIRPDGSDYAFVTAFEPSSDGYHGGNPLLALPDGRVLGSRNDGGAAGRGSIFALTPKPGARAK